MRDGFAGEVTDENGPLPVIPGSHTSSPSEGVGIGNATTIHASAGEHWLISCFHTFRRLILLASLRSSRASLSQFGEPRLRVIQRNER